MQYVGFGLLGLAVILLGVGAWQWQRTKRILAAPFRKTGEIKANPGAADAKGNISCEGRISPLRQLTAPCSGKPCVYYEIAVERKWEKRVQTENGTKTQTGTEKLSSEWRSHEFDVDDGTGAIKVEPTDKVSGDLEKAYKQTKSGSMGTVKFGEYEVNIPHHSEKRTTGVSVVERIVPTEGTLFVMGKLDGGVIHKKDGVLGKLFLSTRGRDTIVAAGKRNMIIALVAAVLSLGPGVYFSITGKPPVTVPSACDGMTDATAATCFGRIHAKEGVTHGWKVTQAGPYHFSVVGTGTSANNRLWPKVTVTDTSGATLLLAQEGNGAPVNTQAEFPAGTYTIHITDAAVADWAERMHGGVGYSLDIRRTGAAPATAPTAAEPAAADTAQ